MKSIGTRFSILVLAFAVVFSGIVLYRTWLSARAHTQELTELQAELALEFDLAIREYAAEAIHPEIARLPAKDPFVDQWMSTTFIAHRVFEKVGRQFPEFVVRFPSDDPRNPQNRASSEELKVLDYFRHHPEATKWTGRIKIDGSEYLAYLGAMRVQESCLACHGRPEDSPTALVNRYGNERSFHRRVGDVAGMTMVAIPIDTVNAALVKDATTRLLATSIWLVALVGAILITFQRIVGCRLRAITHHFKSATEQAEDASLATIPVRGNDEISVLARGFNTLAERLQALHESLEQQVEQRTAELTEANQALEKEMAERTRLEGRIIKVTSREQLRIGQELHDGLGQQLTGLNYLATNLYNSLRAEDSAQAENAAELARGIPRAVNQLQAIVKGLVPIAIDADDLNPALEMFMMTVEKQTGISCRFESNGRLQVRDKDTAVQVYRIAQEAVANALKHGQADEIVLSLRVENDRIEMEVRDDGVGIQAGAGTGSGCGLGIMRHRARAIGGSLDIRSLDREGTFVTCVLPREAY